VMDHRYKYDEVSNILKKTTLDGEYVYEYDQLDRLLIARPPLSLELSTTNPEGLPVEAYSYDAVHNRNTSAHQPGAWVYNENNELTQWGIGSQQRKLTYDLNGSTIKEEIGSPAKESTDYVYDAQDRLIEVKKNGLIVARYAYDPMGRRVWRQAGAEITWFLYSNEGLIEELSSSNSSIKSYGWNPGWAANVGPVWQKSASEIFISQNDRIFTPIKLTSSEGLVVWETISSSFGDVSNINDRASIGFSLRFPGQWNDKITGLSQNHMRDFSSLTGRYTSPDPLQFTIGANLFHYAFGNPNTKIDFRGEDIYLVQGNDSWNPLNNLIHQSICVSQTDFCNGKYVLTGRIDCFSFGWLTGFQGLGWSSPSRVWLGRPTTYNLGGPLRGVVYTHDWSVGVQAINNIIFTTPDEDADFTAVLVQMLNMEDTYSLAYHNCRRFSQMMFEEARIKYD
jgi:RHS repeat-associated protein